MVEDELKDDNWHEDLAPDGDGVRPVHEILNAFYASRDAEALKPHVYWPEPSSHVNTRAWALELLRDAVTPPPPNYLPIMTVDDSSIACIELDPKARRSALPVWRWHLADVDAAFQNSLLDVDLERYARSVLEELEDRGRWLKAINRIARRYYASHVREERRPHASTPRPVQLACQNVIIGLAVVQHDATFDGLRVPIYLTCQVPHVATHEADRAMAGLLLCDAFQSGGTMEIRFGDRGKPARIPPALARFARAVGLAIGQESAGCITPTEARELFVAVTPMADQLRIRSEAVLDRGIITPERLCYVLMSGVWTTIEVDYILATSCRAASILRGGAPIIHRLARQAELETCRAATMIGMLHRFLDHTDPAAQTNGVRVFEDALAKTTWAIEEETGTVVLSAPTAFPLPWASVSHRKPDGPLNTLLCVARGLPNREDQELVRQFNAEHPEATAALLVPADMSATVPNDIPTLVCPDRLADLDSAIEHRSASLRVGRL